MKRLWISSLRKLKIFSAPFHNDVRKRRCWLEMASKRFLWKLKIFSKPFHNDVRKRRCWLERTIRVWKNFLARKFPRENESRSGAFDVLLTEIKCNIPGADYILAQRLKRCSASRISPNETFELAKKRRNTLCFGVCGCLGGKISLCCRQVTRKVTKTVKNLFVLQFWSWNGSFRHGEMRIWLCLYF